MTTNIWKLKNIAPITKMGIEGTVATASLAAAITTVLIATKVIAGPASLALIASPAGIAVLFIAAVYFVAAAYASYQQMHKNEEISELKAEVEGKIEDLATKTELAKKLNSDDLQEKVKGILPTLLVDSDVATVDVKKALQVTTN